MAYIIQGVTKEGYEVFLGKRGAKSVFWSTNNTTFDFVTKYKHFGTALNRAKTCIRNYRFQSVAVKWLNPDGTTRDALKAGSRSIPA